MPAEISPGKQSTEHAHTKFVNILSAIGAVAGVAITFIPSNTVAHTILGGILAVAGIFAAQKNTSNYVASRTAIKTAANSDAETVAEAA